MTVDRLQVWRDVYYLDPTGLDRKWLAPQPLESDEFFVVGDNVSRSRDSRHSPRAGVRRQELLGKVRRIR